MKKNLKPYVYKLWNTARLSIKDTEPKGNQVLIGLIKSVCVDPKPGDLSMSRLKFA